MKRWPYICDGTFYTTPVAFKTMSPVVSALFLFLAAFQLWATSKYTNSNPVDYAHSSLLFSRIRRSFPAKL